MNKIENDEKNIDNEIFRYEDPSCLANDLYTANQAKNEHNKFVSVNHVLREYDDIKEAIKNLRTSVVHQRFSSIYKTMLSSYLKCRKNKESKNPNVTKKNKGKLMLLAKCAVCDTKKSRARSWSIMKKLKIKSNFK